MVERLGNVHAFTSAQARETGKKGGRVVSSDRARMARIGHRGGKKSRRGRSKTKEQNKRASKDACLAGPLQRSRRSVLPQPKTIPMQAQSLGT
jgi:hypothetical protein